MKTYYYQNKNNFIGNTLDELKLFNTYLTHEILELFNKAEIQLLTGMYPFSVKKYNFAFERPFFQRFSKKAHGLLITEDIDFGCYRMNRWEIGLNDAPSGYFNLKIVREDHIRVMEAPGVFVYLNIPYKFLRENLVSNLAGTDLPKFFEAFDNNKSDNLKEVIQLWDHYDKKYPKLQSNGKKPPYQFDVPSWRAGMFLGMQYSLAKFGFGYPIILGNSDLMFYHGSHRLSKCPVVKKDYPILLGFREHSKFIGDSVITITPPWFKDDNIAMFDINYKTKKIQGWFLDKTKTKKLTGIQFPYSNKPLYINNLEYMHILYDELIKKGPDFDFKFKE